MRSPKDRLGANEGRLHWESQNREGGPRFNGAGQLSLLISFLYPSTCRLNISGQKNVSLRRILYLFIIFLLDGMFSEVEKILGNISLILEVNSVHVAHT